VICLKTTAKAFTITAMVLLILSLFAALASFTLLLIFSSLDGISFESLTDLLGCMKDGNILNNFFLFLISAVLCLTVCNKKLGSWSEIVALVAILFIVVVLPFFNNILFEMLHGSSFGRYNSFGLNYEYFRMCVNATDTLANLAVQILLIACGMSIAYKHITRKKV
jgi:hypothetical protein